jgi:hypothetical protein
MIALPKLIVLGLIVAIIWYWSRGLRSDTRAGRGDGHDGGAPSGTETLVACPSCKAYVIDGSAKSCGRPDCPY